MPRSFLVKKHHSSRRLCRGKQSSKTAELSSSKHEDLTHPPRYQEPGMSSQPPHRAPHRAPHLTSALGPLWPRASRALQPCCPNSSTFTLLGSGSDVDPRSPSEALRPAEACTKLILELQRVAGDHQQAEGCPPLPSLPLLALVPGVPAGGRGGQQSLDRLDCHHRFFSRLSKRKHLQCEWSSEKYFSCKYCEKEYISLGALKMHIRTHTLPYVCTLCGKAFSRPWLLQGHIRTHTGEKPFMCLQCSRAFADRSNLRAHLQTHADVKKYQCGSCCKTFSRISLLAKHREAGCPLS